MSTPSTPTYSHPPGPTFDAILTDTAAYPYTLAAFITFLSQNYCLEILEFVLEARRYRNNFAHPQDNSDGSQQILRKQWQRILKMHITPGADREINISKRVRDGLLSSEETVGLTEGDAPDPGLLEPAMRQMHELVHDSIMVPFLQSCASSDTGLTDARLPTTSWLDSPRRSTRGSDDTSSERQRRRTGANDIFPLPMDMSSQSQSQRQSHSQSNCQPPSISFYSSRPSSITFSDSPVLPKGGSLSSGARSMQTTASDNTDLTRTRTTQSRRSEDTASADAGINAGYGPGPKRRWPKLHGKGGIFRHFRRASE